MRGLPQFSFPLFVVVVAVVVVVVCLFGSLRQEEAVSGHRVGRPSVTSASGGKAGSRKHSSALTTSQLHSVLFKGTPRVCVCMYVRACVRASCVAMPLRQACAVSRLSSVPLLCIFPSFLLLPLLLLSPFRAAEGAAAADDDTTAPPVCAFVLPTLTPPLWHLLAFRRWGRGCEVERTLGFLRVPAAPLPLVFSPDDGRRRE